MVPPSPRFDYTSPPAADLRVSMEAPSWVVVTATGDGFYIDGDVQTWDTLDYRTRGTAGPPRPGAGLDGYWQVGNVSNTSFQFLAPYAEDPCVVDVRLRRRASSLPNPEAGVFTDWIPAVFVVGDPPLPSANLIVPTAARPGMAVTITGAGLNNTKDVRLGSVAVPIAYADVTDTAVSFVLPALALDAVTDVPVSIVTPPHLSGPGAIVPAGTLTYLPPGVVHVDDYTPKEGVVDGGTVVTITGDGLDIVLAVTVGGAAAQVLFAAFDLVIVSTPPAPGGMPGPADIVLHVPDPDPDPGADNTAGGVLPPGTYGEVPVGPFTYTARPLAPPPTVSGFLPISGPTTGGTVLSITGTNLDQITEVRVGGNAATDLDATFGLVVCRTPPRVGASAVIVELYWEGDPGRLVAPGLFEYTVIAPPVGEEPCKRRAWLTLPGRELPLEDFDAGYVCVELDIGWPMVREVVTNAPDQDGLDDRTALLGGRVVTAHVIAGGMGGHRTPDDIARSFGPYVNPRVRPVLHWTVDSPETVYAERTLTLRASEFTAPIEGAFRDIHLAWVAPDPIVRAAVWREALSRPAYAGATGRRYNLTFDRVYPAGGGGVVEGQIVSPGDVDVLPLVRIYGPITGPAFRIIAYTATAGSQTTGIVFQSSFRVDAGRFIDIDCARHTATDDTGARIEARIDWPRTAWPVALGRGLLNICQLVGVNTDHVTQAVAAWRDGFLEI